MGGIERFLLEINIRVLEFGRQYPLGLTETLEWANAFMFNCRCSSIKAFLCSRLTPLPRSKAHMEILNSVHK